MIEIKKANTAEGLQNAATLFRNYAEELGVQLCFQDFENELATLPGKYQPPTGSLFLASLNGRTAGCVAHRPLALEQGICEMKRLYVSPEGRGQRLGEHLSETVIQEAKAQGYMKMRLDTLDRLVPALKLYKKLGFYKIDAYYENPLEGVVYLEKEL